MLMIDWFFATSARLEPLDATALLESLSVLRNRLTGRVRRFALEHLAECEELPRLYAVPLLVELLFDAEYVLSADDEAAVRGIITRTVGDSPLSRALAQLAGAEAEDIAGHLRRDGGRQSSVVGTAYLELGEVRAEILQLAVLRETARRKGDSVSGLIGGDDALAVYVAARSGRLGRLPFLLAIETAALSGESPSSWLKSVRDEGDPERSTAWLGQPDLVGTVVRHLPGRTSAADRNRDALTFERLAPMLSDGTEGRFEPDITWLGCGTAEGAAAAAVLWQAFQWSCAATQDPAATLGWLARSWGAPEALEPERSITWAAAWQGPAETVLLDGVLPRLVDYRTPPDRGVRSDLVTVVGDPVTAGDATLRALHSPWLDRSFAREHARDPIDDYKSSSRPNFHHIDDHIAVLRLLASVDTLDVLFRHACARPGAPIPDHLWAYLLNAASALANVRLRKPLEAIKASEDYYTNVSPLGYPLLTLAYYAKQVVDRLGKGTADERMPARLIEFLEANTGPDGRARRAANQPWNAQEERVYAQSAPIVAAKWPRECFTGYVDGVSDGAYGWFDGGAQSPAAALIRLCIGPVWDHVAADPKATRSLGDVSLLAVEAFPELWAAQGRTVDWRPMYARPKEIIGRSDPLLSEPMSLAEWKSMGDLDLKRFGPGAVIAVLTARLLALVATADRISQHPDWVKLWYGEISRVNSPRTFARATRAAIVRIIAATSPDAETDAFRIEAYRIHEVLLDAVAEFSEFAVHYQAALLDALGENYPLGPVSREALEMRWFEVAAHQLRRAVGGTGSGPWHRVERAETDHTRTVLVENLVLDILERTDQPEPLLDDLVGAWLDDVRNRLPIDRTDPDGSFDPRTVLSYQRRGDTMYSGRVGIPSHAADARLGIVAAIDRGPAGSRMLVNQGDGEPIDRQALDGVRPGDFVVLHQDGTSEAVRPVPPAQVDHGIAEVRFTDSAVHLDMDDEPETLDLDRPEVAAYWNPDTLGASGTGPAPIRTAVRRDSATGIWRPAFRNFAQFIVEEVGPELGQARTVAVVELLDRDDHPAVLLSARPGTLYRLPQRCWELGSWRVLYPALQVLVERNTNPNGLVLPVRLERTGSEVKLAIAADPGNRSKRLDMRNVLWRSIFDLEEEDGLIEVTLVDGTWYAGSGEPPAEQEPGEEEPGKTLPVLPKRIVADLGTALPGPGITTARARLRPGGWNLAQQRRGRVALELVRTRRLEVRIDDLATLRALTGLATGSIVRLGALTREARHGLVGARTTLGVEVDVVAETLTLGRGPVPRAKYEDRPAKVSWIAEDRRATGTAEPAALDLPEDAPVLLIAVVLSYGPHDDRYALWLELGGRPLELEIDRSAFDRHPRAAGDSVSLRRTPTGWVATAWQRRVEVRALWAIDQVENHPEDGLPLGNLTTPGGALHAGIEDLAAPIVHSGPPLTVPPERLYGTRVGEGTVTHVGTRHAPSARRTAACLRSGGIEYYGEAASGVFKGGSRTWSGADLEVERVRVGDTDYWDLHRIFRPGRGAGRRGKDSAGRTQANKATANGEAEPVWWRGYRRWLRTQPLVAIGTPDTVRGRARALELTGLTVATVRSARPAEAVALTTIPFERDGDLSWLEENYSRTDIRAAIIWAGNEWTASCRKAPPLDLLEFEKYLQNNNIRTRHGVVQFSLRFAGHVEPGTLRLEWGFGWTVAIPATHIFVGKSGNWNAFFGDEIQRFRFQSRRVDGQPALCLIVDARDIRWSVEHHVWTDVDEGILQQIRVVVYPRSNRVKVVGVHTHSREVSARGHQRHLRFRNAWFDRTSRERIAGLLTGDEREAGEPVYFDVFAQVDTIKHPNERLGIMLNALFIGPMSDDTTLSSKKYLFMIAGPITVKEPDEYGLGNDYLVTFRPAQEVRGVAKDWLQVRVQRRQFSLRESTLRIAYRSNQDKYVGTPMLVQLSEESDRPGTWFGTLLNAPDRKEPSVRRWLATVGEARVIAGTVRNNRLKIELMPGVLFSTRLHTDHRPAAGSLCSLELRGHEFVVRPIIDESDAQLVPREGRPVLVFPKDDTLRSKGRNKYPQLTVAGLPSITVTNRAAAQQFAYKPHPRLAMLRHDSQVNALALGIERMPAGALSMNEWGQPKVTPVRGSTSPPRNRSWRWSQLSFLDDTVRRVAEHARRGLWRYHERITGHWSNGAAAPSITPLSDPVRVDEGPLFFTPDWALRYPRAELPRYGYPATEIVEAELPEDGGWYPVAGTTRTAVWVELAPGRLVKIPGSLLWSATSATRTLRSFLWSVVAPGDRIRLRRRPVADGRLADLDLAAWIPGPRGSFGDGHVLLPITRIAGSGIKLGQDRWTLVYPLTGKKPEFPDGGFCWLTPDNELWQASRREPAAGDVVLAQYDSTAGGFIALGLPATPLELVRTGTADGGLHALLTADAAIRAAVLAALGGCFPARLREVDAGDDTVRLALEPIGNGTGMRDIPQGSIVKGRVLGMIDEERALVRAGSLLFPVRFAEIVAEVPETARGAVAAALDHDARHVWLHWDGKNWRGAGADLDGELETGVVAGVAGQPGIIVRDHATSALLWLDLGEIGMVPSAPSGTVASALHQLGIPLVLSRRGRGGPLSAVERLVTAHGRSLAVGRIVTVRPLADYKQGQTVYRTMVASVHPTNLLIQLRVERLLKEREPLRAEILAHHHDSIVAVPAGDARSDLDLPLWIIEGFREPEHRSRFDAPRFVQLARTRREPYATAARHGIAATAARPDATVDALVTAAYATVRHSGPTAANRGHVIRALNRWLTERVPVLLGAAPGPHPGSDIDAVPMLSGVLLTDEVFRSRLAGEPALAQLAVHHAHIAGLLAAGSMHVELLLGKWLLADDIEQRGGQWLRLNDLALSGQKHLGHDERRFDGTLSAPQRTEVLQLCRGVLARRRRMDDRPLLQTVLALEYAVTESASLDLAWPYFTETDCGRLAALGRALTPGPGIPVSQSELHRAQLTALRSILDSTLVSGMPITLNTRNMPTPTAGLRQWVTRTLDHVSRALGAAARYYDSAV